MVKKFIVIVHLIILGIIVGGSIHFKSKNEIISLVTIFFTGFLALQNIIHKMLDTQEDRTLNK